MEYASLWTHQRETLLAVRTLMRTQPVAARWDAVSRLERMKLSARDFENSEPQFTMRGVAGQCKLQTFLEPPDSKLTTGGKGVQFLYEETMRAVLAVLGVLAGLLSLMAFLVAMTKGTDIQFIAAGVFGTMCAVCFGLGSVIDRLDELKRKFTGG